MAFLSCFIESSTWSALSAGAELFDVLAALAALEGMFSRAEINCDAALFYHTRAPITKAPGSAALMPPAPTARLAFQLSAADVAAGVRERTSAANRS